MGEDVKNISEIKFSVFGNPEVKKYSVIDSEQGIIHPDTYDNSEPKIGGLIDPRLGAVDQFLVCSFCKLNYIECNGHFGHVRLTEPMFHWGFLPYVKQVMSCICLKSCKLLLTTKDIESRTISQNKKIRFNEIRSLCAAVKVSPYSGAPVPKLIIEVKKHTGVINFVCEYVVTAGTEPILPGKPTDTVDEISETKRKVRQSLSAGDCYHILRNVSDEDCETLGICRPENMIIVNFPIPPVAIRPSLRGDFTSQGYSEHGTTHKLADIVKFNGKLGKEMEKVITTGEGTKYIQDYGNCLQYHLATYYDNESMALPRSEMKTGGNAAKSIRWRFQGKTGRIRGNLQAKRVDFSARSVITSDPNTNLDELGVPMKIAMTITYPEVVTPYNIDRLTELVRNGREVYPGANFVENTQIRGPNGRPVKIDLKYKSKDLVLRHNWVVHRHLQDDDVVLFNRQPSLHKMSMMAHRLRVIRNPNLLTFRLNVTATDPYNADFDGDEMNLFAPQSEQARVELELLADIKNYIISPRNSMPIVTLKQDALLGSFQLTQAGVQVPWKDVCNMLVYTTAVKDLMNGEMTIEKGRVYTGAEVFSAIIPNKINAESPTCSITMGNIDKGFISKPSLAGSWNSIPHMIIDTYDKKEAASFMDNVQHLINTWLMRDSCFCVGFGDCVVAKETRDKVREVISSKMMEVMLLITENENTHLLERRVFDEFVFRELSNVINVVSEIVLGSLGLDNNLKMQIQSGAKGKGYNMGMITGCLGQSSFKVRLIEKGLNHRTLPYFAKHDDSPMARGFIINPYVNGIAPNEFFYHNMDGRNGMIDTAINTADTGYMQRKTIKATEDVYQSYDSTVRNSLNLIVQFVYGDSGFNPVKQMMAKSYLVMMDNATLDSTFSFTGKERKEFGIGEAENRELVEMMLGYRRDLREIQFRATVDSKVIMDKFFLPFNIKRVIDYHSKLSVRSKGGEGSQRQPLTPKYIMEKIDAFLEPTTTLLFAMGDNAKRDPGHYRYKIDQTHKRLLRILVTEYLYPRRVMVEYGMDKERFDAALEELTFLFNKNMGQPCEMVGILAAQSLGERLTQFTLNTFHATGISDVVENMSSMLRFRELISFTKNIKAPITRIYLTEEFRYNEEKARTLANTLHNTMFRDLVMGTEIRYETDHALGTADKIMMDSVFFVEGNASDVDPAKLPWVMRFLVNREVMLDRQITILDIKSRFTRFWQDSYGDMKGFRKKEKNLVSNIIRMCIMGGSDNDGVPVVHIRCELKDYDYHMLIDTHRMILDNFMVKGIPGIQKVALDREMEKTFDPETGAMVEKNQYVVVTKGNNVDDILYLEGVDMRRTVMNDVFLINSLYGIEATRAALIKEITDIYVSSGGDVNFQHVSILVDIMTHTGVVIAVNRYGITKLETDVLSRASFEKTIEQFIQAAVFEEVDRVSSVSSRIIAGRVIKGGTGMVDILMDTNAIENTELLENPYVPETPALTLDPLIEDIFGLPPPPPTP